MMFCQARAAEEQLDDVAREREPERRHFTSARWSKKTATAWQKGAHRRLR